MTTALDYLLNRPSLLGVPFPSSENYDIWMNAQNASLNKQQYEACVSILHKTYELQPSASLAPLPFSVKEFTDYLASFIHSRFPAPHTTIRGFIAGGAAVHVLTGREYGDINIRFYFNHPEPLHIVREGVFDYFIQKLRQVHGVQIDESSLSKLLHAYISKTILRDGNPTSFAWFGLGSIDLKCFYTTDHKAHTLADQEAVMISLNQPVLCYPSKESKEGSMEESMQRIMEKKWVPNFEGTPKQYLEMTLQRMNQGYEIVEFERLQTELIRELREISLSADAWFQKKYLPFLSRHYPPNSLLVAKQIFCVLNTLLLLNRLDPKSQNEFCTQLKYCLIHHIPNLKVVSPKCFTSLIQCIEYEKEEMRAPVMQRILLNLQTSFITRALDEKHTTVTFSHRSVPHLKLDFKQMQAVLFLEGDLHTVIKDWLDVFFKDTEACEDVLQEAFNEPSLSTTSLFERTLESFIRFQFILTQVEPERMSFQLPRLFTLLVNTKIQCESLGSPLKEEMIQAMNRLFIFYARELSTTSLKEKVAGDITKYCSTFSFPDQGLEHFLELSIQESLEPSTAISEIVLNQISALIEKNQPIPSYLITFFLQDETVLHHPVLIRKLKIPPSSSFLTLVPKEYHDACFHKLKEIHEAYFKVCTKATDKLVVLDSTSLLYSTFSKQKQEIKLFSDYLDVFKKEKIYSLERTSKKIFMLFEALQSEQRDEIIELITRGNHLAFLLAFSMKNRLYNNQMIYKSMVTLFNQLSENSSVPRLKAFFTFFRQSQKLWLTYFPDFLKTPFVRKVSDLSTEDRAWVCKTANTAYTQTMEGGTPTEALEAIRSKYELHSVLLDEKNEVEKLQSTLEIQEKYKDCEEVNLALFEQLTPFVSPPSRESIALVSLSLSKLIQVPALKEKTKNLLLPTTLDSLKLDTPSDTMQLIYLWLCSSQRGYLDVSDHVSSLLLTAQIDFIKSFSEVSASDSLQEELIRLNIEFLVGCAQDKDHTLSIGLFKKLNAFFRVFEGREEYKDRLLEGNKCLLDYVLAREPVNSSIYLRKTNSWLAYNLLEAPEKVAPHLLVWLDSAEKEVRKAASSMLVDLEQALFTEYNLQASWVFPLLLKNVSRDYQTLSSFLLRIGHYVQETDFTKAQWEILYSELIGELEEENLKKIGDTLLKVLDILNQKGVLNSLSEEQALYLLSPLVDFFVELEDPSSVETQILLQLLIANIDFPSILQLTEKLLSNTRIDWNKHISPINFLYEKYPSNPFIHHCFLSTIGDDATKFSLLTSPDGDIARAQYTRLPLEQQRKAYQLYLSLFLEHESTRMLSDSAVKADILSEKVPLFRKELAAIESKKELLESKVFKESCFEMGIKASILEAVCEESIDKINRIILEFSIRISRQQISSLTPSNALDLLEYIVCELDFKSADHQLNFKLLNSYIRNIAVAFSCFQAIGSELSFFTNLQTLISQVQSYNEEVEDQERKERIENELFETILFVLNQSGHRTNDTLIDLQKIFLFEKISEKLIFSKPYEIFSFLGSKNASFIPQEKIWEAERAGILHAVGLNSGIYVTPLKYALINFLESKISSLSAQKAEYLESGQEVLPDTFSVGHLQSEIEATLQQESSKLMERMCNTFDLPVLHRQVSQHIDTFIRDSRKYMAISLEKLTSKSPNPGAGKKERVESIQFDCTYLIDHQIQFCQLSDDKAIEKAGEVFQGIVAQTIKTLREDESVYYRRLPLLLEAYETFPVDLSLRITPLIGNLFLYQQNKVAAAFKQGKEISMPSEFNFLEYEIRLLKRKVTLIKDLLETPYSLTSILDVTFILSLQTAILGTQAENPILWELFKTTIEGLSTFVSSSHEVPHPQDKDLKPVFECTVSLWQKLLSNKKLNTKSPECKELSGTIKKFLSLLKERGIKLNQKKHFQPIIVLYE